MSSNKSKSVESEKLVNSDTIKQKKADDCFEDLLTKQTILAEPAYTTTVYQHPMYQTTSSDIGSKPECRQTRATKRCPKTSSFTNEFRGGMYKNHSVNTALDTKSAADFCHMDMY
eukprot:769417_1